MPLDWNGNWKAKCIDILRLFNLTVCVGVLRRGTVSSSFLVNVLVSSIIGFNNSQISVVRFIPGLSIAHYLAVA